MTRGDISTTGILNAAVPHLRRIAAPAAGILIITSLPFRLLQVHFIDLLHRLKSDAPHYGNLLTAFAALMVVAFIVSLYGRAVFMRACREEPQTWRDLLRIPLKPFLAYVYVALMIELAFVLLGITFIVIPFAIMISGVAAAASTDKVEPGLVMPLRNLAPYLRHGRVLTGLFFVFFVAYIALAFNFTVLAQILVWAGGVFPRFSSIAWSSALDKSFRLGMAIFAAEVVALEPFVLASMHVYGDRVRSRQSGDDLIRRFRALTSQKAIAATMMLFAVFVFARDVRAHETISVANYVSSLRVARDALAAGRYGDASAAASDLQKVQSVVTANGVEFEPDQTLLRDITESASRSKPDLATVAHVTSTIDALGGGALQSAQPPVDAALLARIRESEKVGELTRGGELKELPQTTPTVTEYIRDIFQSVIDWLADKLEKIFDWFAKLWPKPADEEQSAEFLGVPVVVWVVTLIVVAMLMLLAAYVLRRSKQRAALVQSEHAASSERDADPLSRESNEWERYAAELAAAGRLREAIRAWYHAVLVTLYRAGILHYRKGVTNWEYIAALSPALAWRPQFVSITRRFDREWYGRHDTTPDVLDACATDARAILDTVRETGR